MNRNKGFTIIELMIAIAIIGVVASVAIPAYNNYLKRSKASEVAKLTEAYKLSIADCAISMNITSCDEENGNVLVGTNGKYGDVQTSKGQVIYNFTIDDISFKRHNVIFYVDNYDPDNAIKWSCKTSYGFDVDLLPGALGCKAASDVVTSNVFTDINEVIDYFGGKPIINGVETNPRWFTGGSANVSYLSENTLQANCTAGRYLCPSPYGDNSFELTKADGSKIDNLDQFCKDSAKGYIVNASRTDPSNAGLVCVKA